MTPQWEDILLWLADCQAATAEHCALKKSSPKSERRRHRDICFSLRRMIVEGYAHERPRRKEAIMERLTDAINRLGEE